MFDLAEDGLNVAYVFEGAVCGCCGSDKRVDKLGVGWAGPAAAEAIEGEVPRDANEPDAVVADAGQRCRPLEDTEEGVLNDVFGFGVGVKQGVGDAEEQRGVRLNERGEIDLRAC